MKTRPFELAGLAIAFLLNSLPLQVHETTAIPEAAAPLAKLNLKNGDSFVFLGDSSRGRYERSIDGEVVGTWTSEALSRHIELQENGKTPQY